MIRKDCHIAWNTLPVMIPGVYSNSLELFDKVVQTYYPDNPPGLRFFQRILTELAYHGLVISKKNVGFYMVPNKVISFEEVCKALGAEYKDSDLTPSGRVEWKLQNIHKETLFKARMR